MDIKITTKPFVKPEKPNPFDGVVASLIEAGPNTLGEFIVPDSLKPSQAKVLFSKAARAAGFTASLKKDEVNEKGKTVLGYVLVTKRERKSGKVDSEAAEVAE